MIQAVVGPNYDRLKKMLFRLKVMFP